jgi:hypothetical protein
MEKFSKKTLLNYVNGAGLFGAATGSQTVKFAYTENIAKVGTAAEGTITFYADKTNKTGIIAVGGDVVSSKILNVTSTAVNNGKTGENTITVTFFNATTKAADTITFDVVDAAAAKAYFEDYFTSSNTIAITDGTADVKVDGQTILIDSANKYLKSGLNIAYIAESGSTGATIALRDNSNTVLSSIEVSDIVGDGVLKDSIYHQDTNILELRFGNGKVYNPNDPTTYTKVEVNLQKLIDINDVFIGVDSSVYLDATLDASTVTLNTKMQDPSTADSTHTGLADALKVKQYVDSKTTDLAVSASGDNYVDASVDANDKKHINVAATDKTKTAVALAETAIQGVSEGSSTENYVALTVAAGDDPSTVAISIDDSNLDTKIDDIDASIDNLQAKDIEIDSSIDALQAKDIEIDSSITALKAKDQEIDSSIDRLDSSVSAIETAIAAMDADLSVSTLDGSIGISLVETDGKVTSIGVTAQKSTVTFDNTPGAYDLTGTAGIVTGDAIAAIKNYVDTKSGALDSSVTDTDNFVTVNTVQTDGALSAQNVTVVTADISAGPGAIDVQSDGLVTGTTLENAIESALTWTIL